MQDASCILKNKGHYLNRFLLNITSLSPSEQYKCHKAKKAYKKTHNECAVCGCLKWLEVHHVLPIHVQPALADDPTNFITLCDPKNNGCHRLLAHFGNFSKKWNIYIREYALISRMHIEYMDPVHSFQVPTPVLFEEFAKAGKYTHKEYTKFIQELSSRFVNHKLPHIQNCLTA